MTVYIGCDYSIKSPAVTILSGSNYSFFSWQREIKSNLCDAFKDAGINISILGEKKKEFTDVNDRIRFQMIDADFLSTNVLSVIKVYKDMYFSSENLSYSSSGDQALNLASYKAVFLNSLLKEYSASYLNKIFTYAPQSLKKIAGVSFKGSKKCDMIESFINNSEDNSLKRALKKNPKAFQNKNGKWYESPLADIVDSYWTLQTMLIREKLI